MGAGVQFLAWLAVNVAMIFAAIGAAARLDRNDEPAMRLVFALTAYPAMIVAAGLLPAAFGMFSPLLSLIVAAAMSAALLAWSRRETAAIDFRAAVGRAGTFLKSDPFVGVSLFFLLVVVIWRIRFFLHPNASIDSAYYHIPLALNWYKEGTIWWTQTPYWSYFGNGEMLIVWSLIPFGADLLINLQSLFVWPLFCAATFTVTRLAGLDARTAAFVTCGFGGMRVIGEQLTLQKNDIFVAAMILAATVFLLRHLKSRTALARVGFALAITGAAGAKVLVWPILAFLVTAFFIVEFRGPREGKSKWLAPAALIVSYLVLVFPWMLRNGVLIGNPVHPAPWPGAEKIGIGRPVWPETLMANITNTDILSLGFTTLLREGNILVPLALVALLVAPVVLVARRGDRSTASVLTAGLAWVAFLVWLVTPMGIGFEGRLINSPATLIRYGFALWVLGGVLAAWMLREWLARPAGAVVAFALVLLCYHNSIFVDESFVRALLIGGAIFAVLLKLPKAKSPGAIVAIALAVGAVGAAAALTQAVPERSLIIADSYDQPFRCASAQDTNAHRWLNGHVAPGAKVLFQGTNSHPVFGADLSRRVHLTPLEGWSISDYDVVMIEKRTCEYPTTRDVPEISTAMFDRAFEDPYFAIFLRRS